jgi:hypothetical protein
MHIRGTCRFSVVRCLHCHDSQRDRRPGEDIMLRGAYRSGSILYTFILVDASQRYPHVGYFECFSTRTACILVIWTRPWRCWFTSCTLDTEYSVSTAAAAIWFPRFRISTFLGTQLAPCQEHSYWRANEHSCKPWRPIQRHVTTLDTSICVRPRPFNKPIAWEDALRS